MEQAKNQAQAQALFNLEKRMEEVRRAALRPFHSRTSEEVELELAQLNAEYEAVLASADETRLARVEVTYAAATGRWTGADWEHEYWDDAAGLWQPCRGGNEDACYACHAAEEAAAEAEAIAAAALAAARAGDWAQAISCAQQVAQREYEWEVHESEDIPVWGAFVATITAAADDDEVAL